MNNNNIYFYFKTFEDLEKFAAKHPELTFSVFGETKKGWLSVVASHRDNNNAESGSEVESF